VSHMVLQHLRQRVVVQCIEGRKAEGATKLKWRCSRASYLDVHPCALVVRKPPAAARGSRRHPSVHGGGSSPAASFRENWSVWQLCSNAWGGASVRCLLVRFRLPCSVYSSITRISHRLTNRVAAFTHTHETRKTTACQQSKMHSTRRGFSLTLAKLPVAARTSTLQRVQHSSTTTRLLPPALEQRLSSSSRPAAVETTVPVPNVHGTTYLLDIIIVCGTDGNLRAFENSCPHQAGRLMLAPDGVLTCRLHGARFNPSDGLCFAGPCSGQLLQPLPVTCSQIGDRQEIHASLQALRDLQARGTGGRLPSKKWQPNAMMQQLLDAFAAPRA
jgi:nitrite reductase/ring-hydroxylating ferredoxin subunit